MTRYRLPTLAFAALTAGMLALAAFSTAAHATTLPQLRTALESQGYTVSGGDKGILRIESAGGVAHVQLMEYASDEAIREAWDLTPGEPARARPNTPVEGSRSAYWNGRSILLVDFSAPNDVNLARAAGDAFLSAAPDSAGIVVQSQAVVQTQSPTGPVSPPATGDADLVGQEKSGTAPLWPAALALCAFGLIVVAGRKLRGATEVRKS